MAAASCSGGGGKTTSERPAPGAPASNDRGIPVGAPAWRNTSIHPASRVVAVGGRFVVYGSADGELTLYGLDPSDGHVLWHHPATPSHTTAGIPLQVLVIGTTVAYLRPDASTGAPGTARLVAANPTTGVDRWTTAPFAFVSAPNDCGDHHSICAGLEGVGVVAFTLGFGQPSPIELPATARALGPAIYDIGARAPETIAVVEERKLAWSKTIDEVFGPGHSTDGGWDFELYPTEGLYVASVGPAPPAASPTGTRSVDLPSVGTAGLDARTGRRRWFIPHGYLACSSTVYVARRGLRDEAPIPVLCRYGGPASFGDNGMTLSSPTTVAGFDVATGKLTWEWDADDSAALVDAAAPHVQLDDQTVVVPDRAGKRFALDLLSGHGTAVGPSTLGWCLTFALYTFGPADPALGPNSNTYAGGNITAPCRADGSAAGTHHAALIPHAVGATTHRIVAYAAADAVVAHHVGSNAKQSV
jgi:hypothetical protein